MRIERRGRVCRPGGGKGGVLSITGSDIMVSSNEQNDRQV